MLVLSHILTKGMSVNTRKTHLLSICSMGQTESSQGLDVFSKPTVFPELSSLSLPYGKTGHINL